MSDLIPKKISQLTETTDITDQYFIVDKVENEQENTQRVKLDEVLQTEIKDKITYTSNSSYPTTVGTLTTPNGNIDITIPYDNPPDTDQSLNPESENAISNKAVSTALSDLSDTITADLSQKVDKEEGKGLSTEDFTTVEKEKLADIESGAQVNSVETVNGLTPDEGTTNITIDSLLSADTVYCITTTAEENEGADIAVGIINGNVATITEEGSTVIKEGHIFYLKISEEVTLDDNFYIEFPSSVGLTTSSIKVSFTNKAPVWAVGDIVLLIYNNGTLQYVNNSLATANTAGLIKLAEYSQNPINTETDTAVSPNFLNSSLAKIKEDIGTLDENLNNKANASLVENLAYFKTGTDNLYSLSGAQGVGVIYSNKTILEFTIPSKPILEDKKINLVYLDIVARATAGGYLAFHETTTPRSAPFGLGGYDHKLVYAPEAVVDLTVFPYQGVPNDDYHVISTDSHLQEYKATVTNGVITIRLKFNVAIDRCTNSASSEGTDRYPQTAITNNTPIVVQANAQFYLTEKTTE